MDEANKAADSTGSPGDTPTVTAPAPAAASGAFISAKYLAEKLADAELLLSYAAEVGIKVDSPTRDDVLKARMASDAGSITEPLAANLLNALTTLAVNVRPVTVESLRAWAHPENARKEIPFLAPIAIVVGCVIVVFSLLTFVSSSISAKITADIDTANSLASKLRTELGPSPVGPSPAEAVAVTNNPAVPWQDQIWFGPAGIPSGLTDKEVISDLQQFAATVREIDGYARQLRHCLFYLKPASPAYWTNKVNLELTPGLNVRLSAELTEKVAGFQQVRGYGNGLAEKVTIYCGAIAVSILPLLYALLGAVAYLLRSYEQQTKNRTLIEGGRPLARLLIAGIGGLVVGQFNNDFTQGISVSPFALAFLVGYAVDVFFTFLEGLLLMFVKRGPGNN
jgi:hypothetical protein